MQCPKLNKQEYVEKPLYKKDVYGLSSKTIFKFMTTDPNHRSIDKDHHPYDVDDFERNRALLLCYPEFRARLHETSIISHQWKNLVENWDNIEKLYNQDYQKYGDGNFYKKECCQYIRSLLKLK